MNVANAHEKTVVVQESVPDLDEIINEAFFMGDFMEEKSDEVRDKDPVEANFENLTAVYENIDCIDLASVVAMELKIHLYLLAVIHDP